MVFFHHPRINPPPGYRFQPGVQVLSEMTDSTIVVVVDSEVELLVFSCEQLPVDPGYGCCIWVFPKIGVPENGWFIVENPIKKWIIWEYPYFWKYSLSLRIDGFLP